MALASKTHHATSTSSAGEGEEEKQTGETLKAAFAELKELDMKLIDQRKPVKKLESDIKQVYDVLEKQGYDRKVVKFLYKNYFQRDLFSDEFRITANSYLRAATGGKKGLLFMAPTAQ